MHLYMPLHEHNCQLTYTLVNIPLNIGLALYECLSRYDTFIIIGIINVNNPRLFYKMARVHTIHILGHIIN